MLFGHGDDFTQLPLRGNFSSNVWYGANVEELRAHLFREFTRLTRYPEPDAASLKCVLADSYGIYSENIVITNGSITAFYLIAQAWAGATSTILVPSFAEYEDACTLYLHRISYIRNDILLSELPLSGQDLCWICNPNNPDGRCWSRTELLHLLHSYPETCFVVDQAYSEFVEEEGLEASDIVDFPNLLLVRSISKVHKIPGVRIGYILARRELIARLQRYLIPWSVNALAIEAGKYVLQHPAAFPFPLARWRKDTENLQAALAHFPGLEVMPSRTTFFLVRLKEGRAADLKRYLLDEHRLLIRDASNFRGLDEAYFRLSTQSPEVNTCLFQALKLWFAQDKT